MKQIILIGKLYKYNLTNGPGGVINNLKRCFQELKIPFDYIFLSENNSKLKVIYFLIKKVLLNNNIAINVHTDGYILPLIVYFISRLNKKNTYYLTVHGIYKYESRFAGITKRRYILLEEILYKNFKNIVCVSNKLKEDLKLLYNRTENVFCINNGVDNKLFDSICNQHTLGEGTIKLIYVGGINRRKGIREVLETTQYLVEKLDAKVELHVYGKIENVNEKEHFDKFIANYNLQDNVHYFGMISDKSILGAKYSNSDFQLCLSLYDTFNVAVLESMAVGCPCIISNNCGAMDIIEEKKNGFIIDLKSNYKESILNHLKAIQNDVQLYNKIRYEARNSALQNDWIRVSAEYSRLLLGECRIRK